jgi:SAM-dependent methyltransferase
MERIVEPELLDELPPEDPGAAGSRRDLRTLNTCRGSAALFASKLTKAFPKHRPGCLLDLGAGDGTLLLRIALRLGPSWQGTRASIVDQQQTVSTATRDGFKALGWELEILVADVFDWAQNPGSSPCDVVITNLFLHHFSTARLRDLFQALARHTKRFIALEPRRARWPLLCSRFVGFIGCNHVTRHDAPVSVRAGFSGRELSQLWPANGAWSVREESFGLFSHLFSAELQMAKNS